MHSVIAGATRSLVKRWLQVNVPPMLPTARDYALRVAVLRQPMSVVPGIAMASASAAPLWLRAAVLAVPRVRPVKTDSAAAQIPAFAVPTSLDATEMRTVPAVLPQKAEAHVS